MTMRLAIVIALTCGACSKAPPGKPFGRVDDNVIHHFAGACPDEVERRIPSKTDYDRIVVPDDVVVEKGVHLRCDGGPRHPIKADLFFDEGDGQALDMNLLADIPVEDFDRTLD